jgi:hypothetical protein
MSDDFPAPFGPRRPNIPGGIVSETSFSARVPFGYVFDRCEIERCMGDEEEDGDRR